MSGILEIKSSDLLELYMRINNEVSEYIIENETSISNETTIKNIFEGIAKKVIRQKLNEIDRNFDKEEKENQQKSIQFNLRRIETTMIDEMKQKSM